MKLFFTLATMLISLTIRGQQCMTSSESCSDDDPAKRSPVIGLLGAGNINSEAFEKANASGKIITFVRLYEKKSDHPENLTLYMSFNKNITRSDSLSLRSIVFPDLGNNAFDATLEYSRRFRKVELSEGKYVGHYIVPFAESWIKDFRVGKSDSTMKRFVTTNATIGLRYLFHYEEEDEVENKKVDAFFSASLYYTHNHVLSKDQAEFGAIVDGEASLVKMPLKYNSVGLKLSLEYNKFQFFIDARTVLGNDRQIPNKELRGFTYNIGFITSTVNLFP
jgi:hypothetical protein